MEWPGCVYMLSIVILYRVSEKNATEIQQAVVHQT